MDKNPVISVVVPCHNEADCIGAFIERLRRVFADLPDYGLELVFVNDGSTDNTLEILEQRLEKDPEIVIVDLSRNFGKEAALSAGLQQASGDAAIPMDADLQDPPELVPQMLQNGAKATMWFWPTDRAGRRIVWQKDFPRAGFTACTIFFPNPGCPKTWEISGCWTGESSMPCKCFPKTAAS